MSIFDIFKRKGKQSQTKAYLAVFSANWCGPSKLFLKDINAAGIRNYTLVDVDKNERLASKYAIRSIPTVILFNEKGNIIKKWIGYDDEDPGQSKFVDFIKNGPYKVYPYHFHEEAMNEDKNNYDSALSLIESITGSDEKPAKVENQKLQDGSIYTGEARLCTNGFYLPYGYGKKVISKQLEMTGHWLNGYVNGMCYVNMHNAMVTGHFVNSRPDGWCLSIEGGKGYVFGVFKNDDCKISLGDSVLWMMRGIKFGLKISYKRGLILVGEIKNNKSCGFHFLDNGDLYVGNDDSRLCQNGSFFKFSHDGHIQIGHFENGILKGILSPKAVVLLNGMDPSLLPANIDTNRNYF